MRADVVQDGKDTNADWVKQVRGINAAERIVLDVLADCADADGFVQEVSIQTLMFACELQRTQIFRILKVLEGRKKLISRHRRLDARGASIPSSYRIHKQRHHPPASNTDPGAQQGLRLLGLVNDAIARDSQLGVDIPGVALERADAYYSEGRRVLTLWHNRSETAILLYEHSYLLFEEAAAWTSRLDFSAPAGFEFLYPGGGKSILSPRGRSIRS